MTSRRFSHLARVAPLTALTIMSLGACRPRDPFPSAPPFDAGSARPPFPMDAFVPPPRVSRDLGPPPELIDWQPLPGAPPDCSVRLASDPSALWQPAWGRCIEGAPLPGCSQLRLHLPGYRWSVDLGAHAARDGVGYFPASLIPSAGVGSGPYNALMSSDGELRVLIENRVSSGIPCRVLSLATDGATVRFVRLRFFAGETGVDPGDRGRFEYAVYWSALDATLSTPPVSLSDGPYLGVEQPGTRSSAALTVWMSDAQIVTIDSRGTLELFSTETSGGARSPSDPILVADHVVWRERLESGARAAHRRSDGTIEPFLDGLTVRLLDLEADATHLVWLVGTLADVRRNVYADLAVWRAPLATEPSALRPELVRAFPDEMSSLRLYYGPPDGSAAFGWYTLPRRTPTGDSAVFVEIATGRALEYTFSSEWAVAAGFAYDAHHALVLIYDARGEQTLVRLDLDTLPTMAE